MLLDESVGKLTLVVAELEAVLLEPRPSRAKRPQPLPLGDECGDPILQLLDCSLLLDHCGGDDLGAAHRYRVSRLACRSHVERGTKFAQRAHELSTEALWRRSACGYVYEATVTESPRRIVPPATTSA